MAQTGVDKLSPRHENILNFIIANPTVPMRKVAEEFSMTNTWLSCVVHSDAFQAKLRERQEVVFHDSIMPLENRLTALAHASIDKLETALEFNQLSAPEVRKTTDMVLKSLGYGVGKTTLNVQQNNTQVLCAPSDLVAKARDRIGKGGGAVIEGEANGQTQEETKALEGDTAAAEEFSSGDQLRLGEVQSEGSTVCAAAASEG